MMPRRISKFRMEPLHLSEVQQCIRYELSINAGTATKDIIFLKSRCLIFQAYKAILVDRGVRIPYGNDEAEKKSKKSRTCSKTNKCSTTPSKRLQISQKTNFVRYTNYVLKPFSQEVQKN